MSGASLWLEACEVGVSATSEVAARAIPATSLVIRIARANRGEALSVLAGFFMGIINFELG